ncbi:hypothetical protein F2P81_020899 [Scophthalmus maximus]|uniref:Integrase catalytic domain-containing protein n=1 Tax=Scophthalmus maximus TaxID=52904 RepID=A0A6A4S495_SCOMX|nr:hypothetical protein F2P81_020899 [Scophthalmus maximus]
MHDGPVGGHFGFERTLTRLKTRYYGSCSQCTVAEKIMSEWVCLYGAPQCLHSDQGTNFESAVFQGMCGVLGIEKTRTTPFHPQSDGQVERFNATLQKMLAIIAERCHWDWDLMIPYGVMAYRATKHSSTGLTPNMMLFGRE